MSTYHYWECIDHDPPLRAGQESGQHNEDRLTMLADYKQRLLLTQAANEDCWALDRYRANTQRFFQRHPYCRLRIITEYGDTYNPEGEADE